MGINLGKKANYLVVFVVLIISIIITVAVILSGYPSVILNNNIDATPLIIMNNAKIDINQATLAQLELVDGIGETIAKRIMEYKQSVGEISNVKQLDEVKGIGEKTLEKIEKKFYFKEQEN
jgi:competence protein ComEA